MGSMYKSLRTVIAVSVFAAITHAYSGGSGTAEDPYQISTVQDLIDLGTEPNDYSKHFVMTADIDLAGNVFGRAIIAPDVERHSGVILLEQSFSGYFNGQGHVIHNLHIEGDHHLGLFGRTDKNAAIKSLGLENVYINSTGGYFVGGLVGKNGGIITSSYNTGTVDGKGKVGGLVGFNSGTINSSYSMGTVNGDGYAGGLVGYNCSGSIISSYSTGFVGGDVRIGGLVGNNWLGTIISSYSTGSVTGDERVGSLVGYNDDSTIISSYSAGPVSGNWGIGGLVGCNYGAITTSYCTAPVSGYHSVGGFVGVNIGTIASSFWDMEASGQSISAGGTGLSTALLHEITTFLDAGWDFIDETHHGTCDFWTMSEEGYPCLAVLSGSPPSEPKGSGTLNDPYIITDANDLGTVWYRPVAHYRLESDIDLAEIFLLSAAVPSFNGSFDGNGHVIRHLQIRGGSHLGLFGICSSGAIVSHLGLEAVDVNGTGNSVGSLVGSNDGAITSSFSIGTVSGDKRVGGLVGYNRLDGMVTSSHSTGIVSGELYVGGLVGYNWLGTIISSFSTGAVSGDKRIGGLVGNNDSGMITSSYSTGIVSGDRYVGGLVGNNWLDTITSSYSTGFVTGNDRVGGLVGSNTLYGKIISSYSTGAVNGSSDVGGLVGYNNMATITTSFWDIEASELDVSAGGTGLTTLEMMDEDTFLNAGWDFIDETVNGSEDTWTMPEFDYPRLTWEFVEPNE